MTNAERIRNMTDAELAEWITNMCDIERHEEPYKSIYNLDTWQEEEIHDSYGDLLKWLQLEVRIGENMNEIYLFKAKRIDNGEWVKGYLYGILEKRYVLWGMTNDLPDIIEVYPSTICQYTGLTDKNGQKIWENDVVEFLGHKGIVKFECGSFGIAYKDYIDWEEIEANICPITGCDNALYACENDNFISLWEIYWNFNDEDNSINTVEHIGNIFDNPELLESEE